MTPTTQPTLGQRVVEKIADIPAVNNMSQETYAKTVAKLIDDLNADQKKEIERMREVLKIAKAEIEHLISCSSGGFGFTKRMREEHCESRRKDNEALQSINQIL